MKSLKELQEGYDNNRTGFAKRKREDDEYHVPDPETRTHKLAFNVSKEGGEKHSRTVTISNSTKSHAEAHATAKAHLQKQGYKIHEEAEQVCKECKQDPCICGDDSHGFVSEAKMTAAMKLQRAFHREQEKRQTERKAGEDLLKKPVKEGVKSPGVGWMLKKDPKLAEIIKARKEKYKSFKQHVGKKIEDKD